jgi:flagella basal body P-ring formation protein FlgA
LVAFVAVASLGAQSTPCADVYGDQILGADLARAFPPFQAIPPATVIAPAPNTGGTRVFSEPEMEQLGSRFGIQVNSFSRAICFRVPTAPLNRDAVIASMRRALPSPETRIELADVNPDAVPPGSIEFPLESLTRPATSGAPALWRGEVVSGNRHFAIWVHAKISAPVARVVALESLKQGVPIQPQQLRIEFVDGFPAVTSKPKPLIDTVAGMLPLRSIAPGSEVLPENLVRPLDVARGDLVHVEVRMGKAHLSLNGRAESAGHRGEMIAVRNPESNRLFQARVEGKDSVLVDPQRLGAE